MTIKKPGAPQVSGIRWHKCFWCFAPLLAGLSNIRCLASFKAIHCILCIGLKWLVVTIVPVDGIGMGFCTQTSGNCVGADDVFVVLVGLERRLRLFKNAAPTHLSSGNKG